MTRPSRIHTDPAWLQTLAEAEIGAKGWQLRDPADVERRAALALGQAIDDLFELMGDALSIFNHHRQGQRPLRLVPWQPEGRETDRGFLIFAGAVQLKLVQEADFSLHASLIRVQAYQRYSKTLHRYRPAIDCFGGITWIQDGQLTMTLELIMKQILQDICSAT